MVLTMIAKNIDKNHDPVLGADDKCVYWYGDVTKDDLQAAIRMVKPGEREESVTYMSPVGTFVVWFSSSSSPLWGIWRC